MRTIVITLCLLAAATRVAAQSPEPPREGDRVRVTAPSLELRRRAGTLVSIDDDSVFVRLTGRPLMAIPRGELTQLEVRAGKGRHAIGRYALLGMGIGALAGGIFGATCTDPECAPGTTWIGAGVGAGFGALSGAVVGALHREPRWAPTEVPRSTSSAAAR